MGVLFLLFFVLVAHASSSANNTQTPPISRLLILFLDGLRWDYLHSTDASEGIEEIRTHGCHVSHVKPIFPSNCHANLHALFAGHKAAHPDSFSDKFDPNYTHSELIWNKAAARGRKVKLYHFPFCSNQSLIGGANSPQFECLQMSVEAHPALTETLDGVLEAFANRTVDFAAIYYGEIDRAAHIYGPSSDKFRKYAGITEVSEAVSKVVNSLKLRSDLAGVNFVVVADHGMTDFKKSLMLDRAFKWNFITNAVNLGTAVALWPNHEFQEELTSALTNESHFRVYTSQNLPVTSWGPLTSNLPPILLVAEAGYVFHSNLYSLVSLDHFFAQKNLPEPRGVHGYPPDVDDMHTAFYGYGPAFKYGCGKSISAEEYPFTYDLFPILSDVLFGPTEGISRMDGAFDWGTRWEPYILFVVIFCIFSVVLLLAITFIRLSQISKKIARGTSDRHDLIDTDYDEKV
uniref:glycerophosphocholine cholinephosphodiesterase n=1 Tax=Mesocestoides corti TaxID=53468 RepID=A0A5K3FXH1_MESCO